MAEPFLGEIRMMSFNYAPKNWAMCNGQFLPINQNQALFSLLGTTFGGNGQTTFALPDQRGRTPIHVGQGFNLGQGGGAQVHTLNIGQMPAHTHTAQGSSSNADAPVPPGAVLASANNLYTAPNALTAMEPSSVTNVGGSQPHQNMQPFLTITFCIALTGIFPSPT